MSKLQDFIVLSYYTDQVMKIKRVIDMQLYRMIKIPFNGQSIKKQQKIINLINDYASINSKYMVQYKDSFYDQATNALYIITETMNTNTMTLTMKIEENKGEKAYFEEKDIIHIIYSIACVVKCIHHIDLTMNTLSSDIVYITPDGHAKIDLFQTLLSLLKPLNSHPVDKVHSMKSDIWDYGNLVYYICSFNKNPFNNDKKKMLQDLYFPIPYGYSDSLGRLIKLCLQNNQIRRPSIDNILSFITDNCLTQSNIPTKSQVVKTNNLRRNNSFFMMKKKEEMKININQLKLNPLCFQQMKLYSKNKNHHHYNNDNSTIFNNPYEPHYTIGKMHCDHNHTNYNQPLKRHKSVNLIKRNNIFKTPNRTSKTSQKIIRLNNTPINNNIEKNNELNDKSIDLKAIIQLSNIQTNNIVKTISNNIYNYKQSKTPILTNQHDSFLHPNPTPDYSKKRLINPINYSYHTYNIINYNVTEENSNLKASSFINQ